MSKRKNQPSLDYFFVKKTKQPEIENEAGPSKEFIIEAIKNVAVSQESQASAIEGTENPEAGKFGEEVDIGQYVNQTNITDLEKVNILKNSFVPDHKFKFPF
uniref:Uncharacterized protein LOC114332626 n=1 Tax=Diabrotica virgifera virgifera TaxID=50390 RepID=A0A6P7FTW8_DIAVI